MKKKHVYNRSTGRNYGSGSYDDRYGEKTRDDRSQRNKARRMMYNFLEEKYGKARADKMMKGKDVDHIHTIKEGGKNTISNLRLTTPKKNRGRKE